MRDYPCYIKINEEEGYVFTTGVNFKTFWAGLENVPSHLLLLRGYPINACFNCKTGLEYVSPHKMADFLEEEVYKY